jgi:hypothetical protein
MTNKTNIIKNKVKIGWIALIAVLLFWLPASIAWAEEIYPFPGRAEHLKSGEYWYRGKAVHGAGTQAKGYDLSAIRFDAGRKAWTRLKAGVNVEQYEKNPTNQAWICYGLPIYAIEDGEVIRGWRNAPENPGPGKSHPGMTSSPKTIYGGGNHLVVKSKNGDLILYAHFKPGTIPAHLCPTSKVFTTDASDDTERTFLEDKRPKIKKGQFLGLMGNSGSSSNPHLHIHRQSSSKQALPLAFNGVYVKSTKNKADEVKDWIRLKNKVLSPGPIAILPDYSKGLSEIARHGLPSDKYQFTFNHIAGSGYRLDWIDGYNLKGKIYFNVVFRPGNGTVWAGYHNLNSSLYQSKFSQLTKSGYRLHQVESYPLGRNILYAAIFVKKKGPAAFAYHGRSSSQHQKLFNDLTGKGYRPINISVVSINGNRSYAALYEKKNIGSFVARSFLTPAEYQKEFNANSKKGLKVIYLNAYQHKGQSRFTAIWSSAVNGNLKARHGLTSTQYQKEWEKSVKQGFLTRNVTGYGISSLRFGAVWMSKN